MLIRIIFYFVDPLEKISWPRNGSLKNIINIDFSSTFISQ